MKRYKKYVIAAAAIALMALSFVGGRESVAPAPAPQGAARAQDDFVGHHGGPDSEELAKLRAQPVAEFRSAVDARSRDLARARETLRGVEADPDPEPGAARLALDAVEEREEALVDAYDNLLSRGAQTADDWVEQLRTLDVASARRVLDEAKEEQKSYAERVRDPDPDMSKILDAHVQEAEAWLSIAEDRLRQAERERDGGYGVRS